MSEADAVAASDSPRTRATLAEHLRALGVAPGHVVIAHCSLSSLGWVNGGAQTVIDALLDVIGETGTLVMPAHSGQLSDPAGWQNPPVPTSWIETIRETMPPYDPARTPTRGLGQVAELFRTWPGVVRSGHPHTSFASLGPRAAEICHNHALASPFGEESPLARLYDLGAWVLLLGVGFDTCTALHLAQIRAQPDAPLGHRGAPMIVDGRPQWVTYSEPDVDRDGFAPFGVDRLFASGVIRAGHVGSAQSMFVRVDALVDAAMAAWSVPA